MLKIQNVSKAYSNHQALSNISFEVPQGSIFGLLGPNGAGKTSLIRIINQITAQDSGEVLINGDKIERKHLSNIGYLPEERGLYKDMSAVDHLYFFGNLRNMEKSDITEKAKEWFKKLEMQKWATKKVSELSKGMQQKVQFLLTVIHNPELIILDEPFTGFDPINVALIKAEILRLQNKGTTFILSTHRMESVESLCNELVLINNAKVVLQGELMELKKKYSSGYTAIQFNKKVNSSDLALELGNENLYNYRFRANNIEHKKEILLNLLNNNHIPIKIEDELPSIDDIFVKTIQKKQTK